MRYRDIIESDKISNEDLPSADKLRDWIAGSKVVDGQGNPLTVYHGTPVPSFDSFSNPVSFWIGPGMDDVKDAHKLFFSSNKGVSQTYGKRILTCYLRLLNPMVVDASGARYTKVTPGILIADAVRQGYDGLIVDNLDDASGGKAKMGTTFVATDPDQVWIVDQGK